MIGFVLWIIGLILTFRAAIEIWNINAAVEKRLIAIVLIVLTSWLGLLSTTSMVKKEWRDG